MTAAASAEPVQTLRDVHTHREERREHAQQGVAREPHEARPRVDDDVPDRGRLERGVSPVFEHGRPRHEPDDA